MGPKNLSVKIGSSKFEAQKLIDRFKDAYPGIRAYINQVLQECRARGYVETILGRRR